MGRIGPKQLHTHNTHLFCVSKRFGGNSQSFDKELMGRLPMSYYAYPLSSEVNVNVQVPFGRLLLIRTSPRNLANIESMTSEVVWTNSAHKFNFKTLLLAAKPVEFGSGELYPCIHRNNCFAFKT